MTKREAIAFLEQRPTIKFKKSDSAKNLITLAKKVENEENKIELVEAVEENEFPPQLIQVKTILNKVRSATETHFQTVVKYHIAMGMQLDELENHRVKNITESTVVHFDGKKYDISLAKDKKDKDKKTVLAYGYWSYLYASRLIPFAYRTVSKLRKIAGNVEAINLLKPEETVLLGISDRHKSEQFAKAVENALKGHTDENGQQLPLCRNMLENVIEDFVKEDEKEPKETRVKTELWPGKDSKKQVNISYFQSKYPSAKMVHKSLLNEFFRMYGVTLLTPTMLESLKEQLASLEKTTK